MRDLDCAEIYKENIPQSTLEDGSVHPDTAYVYQEMFSSIYAGNDFASCMANIRMQNGNYRLHKVSLIVKRDNDNEVEVAYAIYQDIFNQTMSFEDEQSELPKLPPVAMKEVPPESIEDELLAAVENNEVVAYFQPVVDLKTKKINSFEALARWDRPGKGVVSPAEFIPAAEQNKTIVQVTESILRQACAQVKLWSQLGFSGISVSVNISSKVFLEMDLAALLRQILQESVCEPKSLVLEIKESAALVADESTLRMLSEIKALGISIAADDCGTMNEDVVEKLRKIPIDIIKIDRMKMKKEMNLEADQTLAMTSAPKGFAAVLSGVETESELLMANRCGYDAVQGYLVSKPMNPENTQELLIKNNGYWSEEQ
ncbi:MAG: EAL domain-containing protein [Candidatus Sumerlaeales bacterium]|nr:EAL domain-containing protein [Candidatus Sumerlaeales bacterium]